MAANLGAQVVARVAPALGAAIEMVIGTWGNAQAPVPFGLYRLRIGQQVGDEFRGAAQKHLARLGQAEVIPFDAGFTPEAEVMRLPVAEFEYPDLAPSLFNTAQLPFFPGHWEEDVAFHCLVVRRQNIQAGFLRRAAQVLVGRRGNLITTALVGNRIESLEGDLLTFSPQVDMVIEPGDIWISNLASFRSLFREAAVLTQQVDQTVAAIAAHLPIANLADFVAACGADAKMMGKLARVARRPYLAELTPADIRAVVEHYHLPADILDAQDRLVHSNNPRRRWLILKLLDDSYLESRMTHRDYEANSKREF